MCETFVSFLPLYGCVLGVVIIAKNYRTLTRALLVLTLYLYNDPVK